MIPKGPNLVIPFLHTRVAAADYTSVSQQYPWLIALQNSEIKLSQ